MRADASDVQEHEIADVSEFTDYVPIIGCAIFPAMLVGLLVSWVLSSIGAPRWMDTLLGALYASFPYAGFVRWVWHKKAIRLQNGYVLPAAVARRTALTLYALTIVVLVWRQLTW